MHYIPPTDENLITRPPSMPIPYVASPPSVRLFFAQYRTEAYCTVCAVNLGVQKPSHIIRSGIRTFESITHKMHTEVTQEKVHYMI